MKEWEFFLSLSNAWSGIKKQTLLLRCWVVLGLLLIREMFDFQTQRQLKGIQKVLKPWKEAWSLAHLAWVKILGSSTQVHMHVLGTDASLGWTLGIVLDIGLKALSLADATKAPFGAWAWIQTNPISNPVSITYQQWPWASHLISLNFIFLNGKVATSRFTLKIMS